MQQKRLTQEERYLIAFLLEEEKSQSEIAKRINRDKSTIFREINRNSVNGIYNGAKAEVLAVERQMLSHRSIKFTSEVRDLVTDYLKLEWSPEQISNYLKKEWILSISIQRIYDFVAEDRIDGGELYKHLRHGLKKKRSAYGKQDYRGRIPHRVSIDERPAIVDRQERIGDIEVDTVIGKNHKYALVTAVDRKTLYTWIGFVPTKDAISVGRSLIQLLSPFGKTIKTITSDNGKEFAQHQKVAERLNCDFYFAHPYASWERGINENTNGLIRQYIRKGTSMAHVTDELLEFIMERLNNRPRKKLGFYTPKEAFMKEMKNNDVCLK
jgi:transposase, IS30 family